MGSTFRDILRIAVPSIITNITTPLLALLDVVIVGHLGDAAFIAAIAVGGSMFNMIYWLFGFLRMGASGLTAQANGASDPRQVALVLWRGILVGLTGAALLILLRKIICAFGMTLMDIPAGAEIYAQKYFLILVWGAPAVLANYCFTGWFLGQMDAKTPMWIAFVINVSNILISLLLVYGFRMKIEGVTFGTLSAQWLGALAGVAVIAYRYRPSLKSLSGIFDARGLKGYFTVNVNIFLRRLCLIGLTVW
ncbi:MAG: MATE family efflux transporter, partial [Duncaniella sp.]|nr:MATE family efflux transporter [Duncaniella sp.]